MLKSLLFVPISVPVHGYCFSEWSCHSFPFPNPESEGHLFLFFVMTLHIHPPTNDCHVCFPNTFQTRSRCSAFISTNGASSNEDLFLECFRESDSVTSVLFLPLVALHDSQDDISEIHFFFLRIII